MNIIVGGTMMFILARDIGDAFITSDVETGDLRRFLSEQCAAGGVTR